MGNSNMFFLLIDGHLHIIQLVGVVHLHVDAVV